MTIEQAMKEWKYHPKKKQRLREICLLAPKRFVKNGIIDIPNDTKPIYIPDKRFKKSGNAYAQLLKACIARQEVIPRSIGMSDKDVTAYLKQLEVNGLIVFHDKKAKTTLRFVPTPKGSEWLSWRNKVKRLFDIVEPLKPDVEITLSAT